MPRNTAADDVVLADLGNRVERRRLHVNWTQEDLAREAGLGKATIERLEAGNAVRTNSLVRVLRALGMLDNIERLIPDPLPSPVEQLKLQGEQRKRASSPRKSAAKERDESNGAWTWGDQR
jgi:transcriptional regulator with XRE-family HTH domain